jgi:hypothetical protein
MRSSTASATGAALALARLELATLELARLELARFELAKIGSSSGKVLATGAAGVEIAGAADA